MAVTQINYYSNSDVSIIDLMNTADASFIGTHQVSLTNYDNTSLPAIAIGSIVENNGALFKFEDETAISGSAVDGTNYILLVPSGDPALGTATVVPTWSQTAPTWSDSKQGYYGTVGSANYRYLEFYIFKSSTNYGKKNFKQDKKIYIQATLSASQTISSTASTKVLFDTVSNDLFYNFDTTNNAFEAPYKGVFSFNAKIQLANYTANEDFIIDIFKNGSIIANERAQSNTTSLNSAYYLITTLILNAGDLITFYADSSSDSSYLLNKVSTRLNIMEI